MCLGGSKSKTPAPSPPMTYKLMEGDRPLQYTAQGQAQADANAANTAQQGQAMVVNPMTSSLAGGA